MSREPRKLKGLRKGGIISFAHRHGSRSRIRLRSAFGVNVAGVLSRPLVLVTSAVRGGSLISLEWVQRGRIFREFAPGEGGGSATAGGGCGVQGGCL